jgi:hypothetical protein
LGDWGRTGWGGADDVQVLASLGLPGLGFFFVLGTTVLSAKGSTTMGMVCAVLSSGGAFLCFPLLLLAALVGVQRWGSAFSYCG